MGFWNKIHARESSEQTAQIIPDFSNPLHHPRVDMGDTISIFCDGALNNGRAINRGFSF